MSAVSCRDSELAIDCITSELRLPDRKSSNCFQTTSRSMFARFGTLGFELKPSRPWQRSHRRATSRPRKAFPEYALAMVSAVHATLEGIRTGGSGASDPIKLALANKKETTPRAIPGSPIWPFNALRVPANLLAQSTVCPRLLTQVAKLLQRHRNELASHGVMSRPAELMAGHLIFTWPRKLQVRLDDITGNRLNLYAGLFDARLVHHICARDPNPDGNTRRY